MVYKTIYIAYKTNFKIDVDIYQMSERLFRNTICKLQHKLSYYLQEDFN